MCRLSTYVTHTPSVILIVLAVDDAVRPVEVLAAEGHGRVVPLPEDGCAAGGTHVLWWFACHVVNYCVYVNPADGEVGYRLPKIILCAKYQRA